MSSIAATAISSPTRASTKPSVSIILLFISVVCFDLCGGGGSRTRKGVNKPSVFCKIINHITFNLWRLSFLPSVQPLACASRCFRYSRERRKICTKKNNTYTCHAWHKIVDVSGVEPDLIPIHNEYVQSFVRASCLSFTSMFLAIFTYCEE